MPAALQVRTSAAGLEFLEAGHLGEKVMEYLIAVVVVAVFIGLFTKGVRRITIFEYEKGLKYTDGKFTAVLGPGQYWYVPFFVRIEKFDIRPCFVSIVGQEVLSSDGVTLKVSLAANYQIVDLNTAINKAQSYQDALYLELQLALREIIGSTDIDSVLKSRNEFSVKLVELTLQQVQDLGLQLNSVNLKDIMFPGKLKEIFAQVVNARQEGLAALEKARGETAALRALANAAKMIESNPNLLQLRQLQALSEASGNTLILGLPPQSAPVPIPAGRKKKKT